jgi:hypothetical protein
MLFMQCNHILTKETLLKGKAQYTWPPCANLLTSAPFYIENMINIFNKTSYLNEEVNCSEPSPSVSVPCFDVQIMDRLKLNRIRPLGVGMLVHANQLRL